MSKNAFYFHVTNATEGTRYLHKTEYLRLETVDGRKSGY